MNDPRSILITGASSGIGAALAEIYAAPGRCLVLGGRDRAKLERVADLCRQRGAEVVADAIDVADREATGHWVLARDAQTPFDLVIANAGISAGTAGTGESEAQTRAIMEINVTGIFNTVLPLLPRLQTRRRGQIALMASIVGFRGFAGAPAYCASKAAVRVWGEGLRGALAPHGIGVSVICPGFVETPMTAKNGFRMPFLMSAARAAAVIREGLARDRARIAFPWQAAFGIRFLNLLPLRWAEGSTRRLPEKAPLEIPPPLG